MRCVWSRKLRHACRLRPAAAFVLVLAAPASLAAADGWRAAPLFGADVRSLAHDPHVPGRVLAGTSSGQIYESTDSGTSWQPAGARVALPGWVVSDLQFDSRRPGKVWAGLWALWGADGKVILSSDGGRTWEARDDGLPSQQVYALALAPDRPDSIYAATRKGVWASEDAGLSWRHLTAARTEIGKVTSLLIDPYRPEVLYAGTWRRAYRSDDRGVSWRGIFEGMALDSEVFSLRPGPRGEGDLWASTCGWVYHGRDRGARWSRHTSGLPERRTPSFEVLADGTLLAGTVAGVYGSNNQGVSWSLRSPAIAVATIAADPTQPGIVLVGSEGSGAWRSLDGGRTFESSATGMVSLRVTDIVASRGGLAMSVRYAEHNDGVHQWRSGGVEVDRAAGLPTVLDLASQGESLFAATERGLWQRATGGWSLVAELGADRFEEVVAGGDRVYARSAREVISLHGSEVERVGLAASTAGLVWWVDAAWFVDQGRLIRWSPDGTRTVAVPDAVEAVRVFGSKLVVETPRGRFEHGAGDSWRALAIAAPRVLPTGDRDLPMLGLWNDGSATLHDIEGRELTQLRLPVPARDVSASILDAGRLHLATAGYGLLWTNVLLVSDPASTSASAVTASSR